MDPKVSKSKRLDLQGIRGIAILAVLGFHFYPEHCPNGYLGVDQFFVLSGYLMCMLLKRAENQPACSLITLFYSKRFKRILPLYFLVIFISMICLYNLFPDTAIETNQKSALHALLFVSNRPKTDQEDYFSMLSIAVDIFTHTWSLSVEIQFYFSVPLIFLLASRLSEKYQYGYYGVIGLISFAYCYTSPASEAFNSVFARIWQFLIGMIVYLLSTPNPSTSYEPLPNPEEEKSLIIDEESQQQETTAKNQKGISILAYILLDALISIMLFPTVLPVNLVRPGVTIGTGVLMLISDENELLSNNVLTFIGDISYSLYLIHWPMYAFWKLTYDGHEYYLFVFLISSFVLAIICFKTFEEWYLKLSSTNIGVLVVTLFLASALSINKDEVLDRFSEHYGNLDGVTEDMTTEDVIRLNNRWNVNDMKLLYSPTCEYEGVNTPLGWCRHKGLSMYGKYKMAIIGNSWTANVATLFYQECGHRAKSILQGSATGCEAFYPSLNLEMCRQNLTDFVERIEKEKPDYAFVISRYVSIGAPFPKNVTSMDQDPIYQTMKAQLLKLLPNIKRKMYILDAFPEINRRQISKIATMVRDGTDPVEMDYLLVPAHQESYQMARRRYAQLLKDCGEKCVLIDYVPEFFQKESHTFRIFDKKGFSYFTTPSHLSPHGIEHVRGLWKNVCRDL